MRTFLRSVFVGDTRSEQRTSSLENPSTDLIDALAYADEAFAGVAGVTGGAGTYGGIRVTPEGALRMVAVYACIRVLAEDVGSTPFALYRRQHPRGRERLYVLDDPRAGLLAEEANPELEAGRLWELVTGHMNLWGNAYTYVELDQATGKARALWPLRPDRTRPVRTPANELAYVTFLDSGEERLLLADEVLHYRAFGTGELGISPIGLARKAVGLALAAEDYAGGFYDRDGRPGGAIQYKGRVSDQDYEKLIKRWDKAHKGLSKSHLVGILDNGAEWKDVGAPPTDVAFLETRRFQRREIAALFRVPPRKLGDVDEGSSFASAEQDNLDYDVSSLAAWFARIERTVKRGLFSSSLDQEAGVFPEFLRAARLRGDTKSRFEAYAIAIQNRWLSPADVRELENLPYVEGLDTYEVPAARATAAGDTSGSGGGGTPPEGEGNGDVGPGPGA